MMMPHIDHLTSKNTAKMFTSKIEKYSKMLDKVSQNDVKHSYALKAFAEATQEMPLVALHENSLSKRDKALALSLKEIIKGIFKSVMGKHVYFADEEDIDFEFNKLSK